MVCLMLLQYLFGVLNAAPIFHMVYNCRAINLPKIFLRNMLTHCNIGDINLLKFIFLDVSKRPKKQKNTVVLLIVLYISSIWYGRKNKMQILKMFKSVILNHLKLLRKILGDSMNQVFTSEFCELSQEIMYSYQ